MVCGLYAASSRVEGVILTVESHRASCGQPGLSSPGQGCELDHIFENHTKLRPRLYYSQIELLVVAFCRNSLRILHETESIDDPNGANQYILFLAEGGTLISLYTYLGCDLRSLIQ
jgi:hypothetical protein